MKMFALLQLLNEILLRVSPLKITFLHENIEFYESSEMFYLYDLKFWG